MNQLLVRFPPALTTPRLRQCQAPRTLVFDAVDGLPLGTKYPPSLDAADIDAMIALARAMESYKPPSRRWFRKVATHRRLHQAHNKGLLTTAQLSELLALAHRHHRSLHFAHGDLTARNVLRTHAGYTLIDWEWAGLYPPAYDLAFLWFSLVDVPEGRAYVQARVDDLPSLWLSALIVQLWHLQWYARGTLRDKHLATRDSLIGLLCSEVTP